MDGEEYAAEMTGCDAEGEKASLLEDAGVLHAVLDVLVSISEIILWWYVWLVLGRRHGAGCLLL